MATTGTAVSTALILAATAVACGRAHTQPGTEPERNQPYVAVLGVTQDGGSPHIGCEKGC